MTKKCLKSIFQQGFAHVFFWIFLISLIFCSTHALAQTFYNLDFEESCDSSLIRFCHWQKSWGGKSAIQRSNLTGKNQSLLIEVNDGVGFVEQTSVIAGKLEMKIITLFGKIKTENVTGKGAGLNISVFDFAGTLLFNKDMGYASFNWATGTADWKAYQINAVSSENAANIKIGAILYGSGKAWFDDFEVDISSIRDRIPSKIAREYVGKAMDTISIHSLRRDSLNIDSLLETALCIAGPAENQSDCHLAVSYLLQSIGDQHSFFMNPEEVKGWESGSNEMQTILLPHEIIKNCGYILVPAFHGGNTTQILDYADSMQSVIQNLSASNIKGWIIDLRENTGGNMEPMIAGLGPLFDSGSLGSLVDVNRNKDSWKYQNGTYFWESESLVSVSSPVVLSDDLPKAVLIGPQTGSSGEIVAISFIGNRKTKTFGQPTWGLTTGNGAFDLPDGARMMLASTIMADRNGNLYLQSIKPDSLIEDNKKDDEDAVLNAAINWILNQ